MAKIDIFSSMLHSAILDRDPEMFADEFYDTGKVLQFELYGDEGEETLTERVFHKGSGSHSGGFWNFEGERYSFHISCSQEVEDLHFEYGHSLTPLKHSFALLEWIDTCRSREEYICNTEEIENMINNAESREEVILPKHENYNVDLIQDLLDERF